KQGHTLCIAPDGPRGPAGEVKPGTLMVAILAGFPILPVAYAARRAWRAPGWDRLVVPQPFTTVQFVYGEPMLVERGADREAAAALYAASRELAERGLVGGELSLADLIRLPDVVRIQHAEEGWGEAEQALLLAIAARALTQFTAGRESEGARLRVILEEK